ncbi:hypothetical protein EG68_01171 [Paragonimus skrjabini miyazakii]|uniref:Uncharacterized protein n=1 Tax=Paragonimus skrjabini miyazakii TaxID=59628 RepID=A0A8S9Z230_9TREM|nr:hypothetical protein EG68_01171 [Paragonimus skrjabini miyazakii]
MCSDTRDHIGLFLFNLLEEDPKIMTLCSVPELASIYSQEMGVQLDEECRGRFTRIMCSLLCDLMNYQEFHHSSSTTRRAATDKISARKTAVSGKSNSLLKAFDQENEQATKLSPKSLSDVTVSAVNGAISIRQTPIENHTTVRRPRKASLIAEGFTYQQPLNSPSRSCTVSTDSSVSSCDTLLQRISKFTPTMSKLSLITTSPSLVDRGCDRELLKRTTTPIITPATIPSTAMLTIRPPNLIVQTNRVPTKPHIITRLSPLNISANQSTFPVGQLPTPTTPITDAATPVAQRSDSPPYITVKRKLSEAVVSIRPAPSRLIEEM